MTEEAKAAATEATQLTETAEATQTEATQANTAQATGDATGTNSGSTERMFTQADVDRIVKERLDRASEKAKQDAEKAAKEAEAKRLAEEGKYKELFEKQQADLQAAQAEAKAAALKLLQLQAAGKAGFPLALADRLKGETEEEMIADAKAMLAALPKPAAPNINANSGGAPSTGQLSDAEKQELAARLGVNPKFM